jgi:hypothetical protein
MGKNNKDKSAVEAAEVVLADLEAKAARLVEHGAELAEQRRAASYQAHAQHDAEARKVLDRVNAEVATHASEMASIDDAIATAKGRLGVARAHEASRADREKAQKLREAVQEFLEIAGDLDEAIGDVAVLGRRLNNTWREMQLLGAKVPTHSQMESLGGRAVAAAILGMPWARLFSPPPISPHERHSFAELAAGWAGQIERASIAPHLGAQQSADEAA